MGNRFTPKEHHVSGKIQSQVLTFIKDKAGKPCPTNGEISEALSISKDAACNAISSLCQRGLLKRRGTFRCRIFTIVDTGESTLAGPPRFAGSNPKGGNDGMPTWGDVSGSPNLYKNVKPRLVLVPVDDDWRQP